jgi:hypothetical protein
MGGRLSVGEARGVGAACGDSCGSPLEHGRDHIRHRPSCGRSGQELAQAGHGSAARHRALAALPAREPIHVVRAIEKPQIAIRLRTCELALQPIELTLIHTAHLVGGHEQLVRHSEAEHPGGRGVDDQLELARLHDRQISRLRAP